MDNSVSVNVNAGLLTNHAKTELQPLQVNNGLTIKAGGPSSVSPTVWQDAQKYIGYRQEGDDAVSQVNLLTTDKDEVTL